MLYEISYFGVCLGHQAIVEAFGGTVSYAQSVMHGKSSIIKVDTTNPIFKGIEKKTAVARYHSLAAKKRKFTRMFEDYRRKR